MADPRARYQLSDGRTVTVPASNAETAQKIWSQKGLKFELLSPAIPAKPDKFSAGDAALRGAAQGAGVGLSDEASGFGAWLAGGAPRQGRGMQGKPVADSDAAAYDEATALARKDDRQAALEHPVAYGAGEIAGAAPGAIALGGGVAGAARAARFAPAAARLAVPAVTGALDSGAQAMGRSEARDIGGRALDATIPAGVGGVAGVVGEEVVPRFGKWLGSKARGGAETLREIGDEAKLAASGAERGAMKRVRQMPGGIRRYAEGAERLGIGKNRLGVIPATVRQHADDAAAAGAAAGARKTALEAQIRDVGVSVDGADAAAAVRALAEKEGKGPAGAAVRAELESIAQDFEGMGRVPFSEMGDELRSWGDATNFASGTVRQGLRKKVYNAINDTMESAATAGPDRITPVGPGLRGPAKAPDAEGFEVDVPAEVPGGTIPPPRARPADVHTPRSQAIPPPAPDSLPPASELGKQWRQAKEDQHVAIELEDIGDNRLNTAGNRVLSPTDYAVGGAAYLADADPLKVAGAVAGNRLLKTREHAIKHQLARGTQRALEGVSGNVAPGVGAATGAATATAASSRQSMSRETAAEADAMADPKYGRMIMMKPQAERSFVIGVLAHQDPEFRARQREAASKRNTDNAR